MVDRSLPSTVSSGFAARALCVLTLALANACAGNQQAPDPVSPAPASAESQTSSAPAEARPSSGADTQRKGRASVFVVHKMSDFEAFRKYFESGAAEREKAGEKGHLLTKLDDGRAVVHFFGDDVAAVEKTLRSPEMEKYVERTGAPEATLLWLTRDVFVKLPPAPVAGETYSLFLKLETDDLPALESALLENGAKFAAQGVVAYGLHQTTTKESVAIAHFVGTDKQRLAALPDQQEFRDLLARTKTRGGKALVGVDLSRGRPD
jgi:hypothetical protein